MSLKMIRNEQCDTSRGLFVCFRRNKQAVSLEVWRLFPSLVQYVVACISPVTAVVVLYLLRLVLSL